MDYKIIWMDEAIAELESAVRFIARDNSTAALKLGEALQQKALLLATDPRLGGVFKTLDREDVRELSVPPYRIIYHLRDCPSSVWILQLWDRARKEPEISAS
jgi:plasmid stabilization system protein ParE